MGKIFLVSIGDLRNKELYLDKSSNGFGICSGKYCMVNELKKQEVYDILKQLNYSNTEISKMFSNGRKYQYSKEFKYGRKQVGKVPKQRSRLF